jgi:hypothetical protein
VQLSDCFHQDNYTLQLKMEAVHPSITSVTTIFDETLAVVNFVQDGIAYRVRICFQTKHFSLLIIFILQYAENMAEFLYFVLCPWSVGIFIIFNIQCLKGLILLCLQAEERIPTLLNLIN